jgi:hypothetical protein
VKWRRWASCLSNSACVISSFPSLPMHFAVSNHGDWICNLRAELKPKVGTWQLLNLYSLLLVGLK